MAVLESGGATASGVRRPSFPQNLCRILVRRIVSVALSHCLSVCFLIPIELSLLLCLTQLQPLFAILVQNHHLLDLNLLDVWTSERNQGKQDDSITLSLTDTQDGGLLWCDFPEALPAHLAGVAPTTRSFPASLPFNPPDADTTRGLPTSNAANASYHQAASTDESTGALSDKPSAGGKENKRPPTQQVTTHLMLVCQANMCNAQFAWTTHAQQHFSQTKRPEPRFCQACQDKRRIKNQRQFANTRIKKK